MSLLPYWLALMTNASYPRLRGGGGAESPSLSIHSKKLGPQETQETMQPSDEPSSQRRGSDLIAYNEALGDFDNPPPHLLEESNPHESRRARQHQEGRRLRLLEEARQNMLSMDEQRKDAVQRAKESLEVKTPINLPPTNVQQRRASMKQRNKGKGRQDGLVSGQQPNNIASPSNLGGSASANRVSIEEQQQNYAARWTSAPVPQLPYVPPHFFTTPAAHQQHHQTDTGKKKRRVKDRGHHPSHALAAPPTQSSPAPLSSWMSSTDWRPTATQPHHITTPEMSFLPTHAPLTRGMYGTRYPEEHTPVAHASPYAPLGPSASSPRPSEMPPLQPRVSISSSGSASSSSPRLYGLERVQELDRILHVIDQAIDQALEEISVQGIEDMEESEVLRIIVIRRLGGDLARYQAWLQDGQNRPDDIVRDG